MKMKKNLLKKFTAIVLTAAVCLSASACGNAKSSETSGKSGKTYKVGVVQYVDDASLNLIEQNVESRLKEIGKEKGVKFEIDYQNGQADGSTLNQIAANMVADKEDCIVAIATPTAQIMQAATEGKNIPIIFSAASDPVGAKLVNSMDKPGANITGTSDALNTEAVINLMLAAKPDTKKVGLLYSKSEDASAKAIKDAKKILDKKGIKYVEKTGTTVDEVSAAADALIAEKVDSVFTPTDNTIMTAELSIYEKLSKAGIAHFGGADSFALNGAFCGFGVNYANLGSKTADMVADVLVNGSDPASTPVETFDNGIATINTETCKAIGLNLDDVEKAFKPYCTSINETKTNVKFNDASDSDAQ